MRVLIDASTIREYRSGFGRYVGQLVEGFLNLGPEWIEILLVVNRETDWWVNLLESRKLEIVPITLPKRLGLYAAQISWTLRRLATRGVDLWHSLVGAPPLGLRIRTVVTVHDLAFYYYPHAYTKAALVYWKWVFKACIKRAAKIIAVSENTRRDVIRLFGIPPSRVVTVYNALSLFCTGTLMSKQTNYLNILPERYVLYVGALNPRKNVATLIEAFAIMKKKTRLPHKLVLCGAAFWNDINVLQIVRKHHLEEEVLLIGAVPDEMLLFFYKHADLFVYPSLYEGFGYPPLEAMALGVPVIASCAPPLPEILADGARYFYPHDPVELAEAMSEILTNPSVANSLKQRGRERAMYFTIERMIKGTLAVYQAAYDR